MGKHRFSRLLALCLAVVMVLGSAFSVSAATKSPTKGKSATVTNKGADGNITKKTFKVSFTGKNVQTYRIRYRTAGSKTWKIAKTNIKGTAKSATTKALKLKGLYDLQVQAKGKDGKWVTAKTISRRYMRTASKVKVAAKKKAVKVSWKKLTGVSGYQIIYSTKKSMAGAKKVKSGKKSYAKTLKGLKSGKTYYVQVRPYKIKNGKKYYGVYSQVKKVKVK